MMGERREQQQRFFLFPGRDAKFFVSYNNELIMSGKYKNKYRIPSARLQGYDYGQNGAYFITICTNERIHYFGDIISSPVAGTQSPSGFETQNLSVSETQSPRGSETQNITGSETQNITGSETQNIASLRATPIGMIANEYWQKIPEHFPFVILDEFVVMPNHVHGIINISKPTIDKAGSEMQNVPDYTNKFGSQSGNISSIIRGYKAGVKSFATINKIDFAWQPRFHDHIIRDDDELKRIRKYILENRANWFRDRNNKEDLYM